MQDIRQIPYRQERPIQFSGLLTNKLLTSLPGPVFAALLPHLEPVSFSAGQEIYAAGARVESIYFPETAVISQTLVS